jgi:hypothetical protein
MTEEGFKPKLTAILIADFKENSRLMPGPEKPMPHKLPPFSASKTNFARQHWLPYLYWATGCDEGKYLINFALKS